MLKTKSMPNLFCLYSKVSESVGQHLRIVKHNLKGLWNLHFFLELQTRTQQSLWTSSDFYTVTAQKWQEYNCFPSIFDISAIVAINACLDMQNPHSWDKCIQNITYFLKEAGRCYII